VERTYQAAIRVNGSVASKTGLAQGDAASARKANIEITLPVIIDERVPDDSVLMPVNLSAALLNDTTSDAVTLSRA
jgi:predicted molibdopterin-dependent oxidoreductase YjgC